MFDSRDYELLTIMTQEKEVSLNELLDRLEISKRVFYYALSKINQYLSVHGYHPIEKNKDFFRLTDEATISFIKDFITHDLINDYIYSQDERQAITILLIIQKNSIIKIQDLMDYFSISKNSVMSDLKAIRNDLSDFYASLEASPLTGYKIHGPLLRIREIIVYTLNALNKKPYILHGLGLNDDLIQTYNNQLTSLEHHLKMPLTHAMKTHLSIVLAYLIKFDIDPIIDDDALDALFNQPMYQEAKNLLSEALKKEASFIFLHFMDIKKPIEYAVDMDYVESLTRDYIETFKQLTSINFKEEEALFNGLKMHLKQSLLRYKYAILIENSLKTQFIRQYFALYTMTKRVIAYLSDSIAYKINEDDIVFIAMHFGGHLRRENKVIQFKKVILICEASKSESERLKQQILSAIDFIEITHVGNKSLIDQVSDYSAIITTVSLFDYALNVPIYMITQAFTEVDKTYLYHAFLVKEEPVSAQKIIDTIKPFIQDKDIETVTSLIHKLYHHTLPLKLSTLLTSDMIQVVSQFKTLKQAIEVASLPLLKNNMITLDYMHQATQNVLDNPTHMHVLDDVFIVHARPSEGAMHDGVSYLKVGNPLSEKGLLCAHIFVIAGKDSDRHLELLSLMGQFLETYYMVLKKASSKKEIVAIIQESNL